MENTNTSVMSVKDWFITVLIVAIPIVGFIMLFVWGFGGGANANKQNWAKATLLWFAVIIALYILFFAFFGAAFLAGLGNDFDF
jgi:heme/copper-type cytochrome/quinol oxidase subunit 2